MLDLVINIINDFAISGVFYCIMWMLNFGMNFQMKEANTATGY
jgi:hypothetical protein